MSEHTPTTEQVREVWAAFSDYGGLVDRERSGLHDDRQAEFDRWLAQVQAESYQRGADDWADEQGRTVPNPYRQATP